MKEKTITVGPKDVWRGEHVNVHWSDGAKFYAVVFNNRDQELLTLRDEDEEDETFKYEDFDGVLMEQTCY
jgi:hypothetical protein